MKSATPVRELPLRRLVPQAAATLHGGSARSIARPIPAKRAAGVRSAAGGYALSVDPSEEPVDPGTCDVRRVLSEVQSPRFEVAFRGYDPAQVHALLDRVTAALRGVVEGVAVVPQAGRDQGRPVPAVLDELVARVAADIHGFREEARAEAMRRSAEAADAAARIVADAEVQAAALLAAAREAATTTLSDADREVAAMRSRARSEARAAAAGEGRTGDERPDAERSRAVESRDPAATVAGSTSVAASGAAGRADPSPGIDGDEGVPWRPPRAGSGRPHPRAASR